MQKPNSGAWMKYTLTALISVLITSILCFLIFLFGFADKGAVALKYAEIKDIIDTYYIRDYDEIAAEDAMFDGFIGAIDDRYSEYYNQEETEAKADAVEGKFYGIGVSVVRHPDNNTIYIKNVYNEGSAAKAGLTVGDEIIKVDDISVKDEYSKAITALQGHENDTVNIEYSHGRVICKAEIPFSDCTIQSVYYSVIDGCGYVEITAFNDATVNQFKDAVDNLESASVKGIIFDLRNNGGGTVDSVCDMLDYICPKGDIMYVKYANSDTKKTLKKSDDIQKLKNIPIAVLVNSQTASAAELFTANIRDFSIGTIIGEKTYGKGVMQMTFSLKDGSSVKTTVAEFYPHSGVSFNKIGIEPDVEVELTEEQGKYIAILKGKENPYIVAALECLNEK